MVVFLDGFMFNAHFFNAGEGQHRGQRLDHLTQEMVVQGIQSRQTHFCKHSLACSMVAQIPVLSASMTSDIPLKLIVDMLSVVGRNRCKHFPYDLGLDRPGIISHKIFYEVKIKCITFIGH